MKYILLLSFTFIQLMLKAQAPEEIYAVDSASVEHAAVPRGEVLKFSFNRSTIFPGTVRDYWIYVPAQYKPGTPACVYVQQDGLQKYMPTVFDNLINSKEMPVTIGLFISPGVVKAADGNAALDRFNRSFEYDGMGNNYVRFLLEEIFPDAEKQQTSDGRKIQLSRNGNNCAIGGMSSGAVCAFTAAWERPASFSRVFSAIGTYIGLRGAEEYPTLIRKYQPKPIRVFLQDGTNDLNIYAGDWWKANETMERALTFAGYEVQHVWGEGQHNGKHAAAIFPQAMRWLWKGWPVPVKTGNSNNQFLKDLLIPGEDWELIGDKYSFTEGTATNAAGEVFFQDIPTSNTYKIDVNGKLSLLKSNAKKTSGTAFGPDGKRYVTAGATRQIIAYDAAENETIIADSTSGNDIVVANNRNIYITSPVDAQKPGKLYLIKPGGEKIMVDEGLKFPNGLTLSPDQTQLYVTESATHWVWAYQVQPNGRLAYKQRYGFLHTLPNDDNAWSDGLRCDTAGRIYTTTNLGLQIMDQMGRVNAILPLPAGQSSNCVFGGKNLDVLYVTAGNYVYRRKLKTKGVQPFEKPLKPMPPKL